MSWRPSAALATLQLRAQLLAAARVFFAERQVLEVDTPALLRHAVTDLHIHSAEVQLPGHRAPLYLQTSPEYAMKRLLAAGSGDIYQIAHVFRGEERSRQHNAEFTLIEWYRCGYSMQQLMQEVALLAGSLLGLPPAAPFEAASYQQTFQRQLDCDPLTATDAALRTLAISARLDPRLAEDCSRDELLDWLMGSAVGPRLEPGGCASCTAIRPARRHWRASTRMMRASRCASSSTTAGWNSPTASMSWLTPPSSVRRFEADREQRRRRGLPVPDIDQALLAALAAGLPPVSGVALGFDRLLMLRTGASDISEVLPFALERA